jgi:hypothetical protein
MGLCVASMQMTGHFFSINSPRGDLVVYLTLSSNVDGESQMQIYAISHQRYGVVQRTKDNCSLLFN